MRLYSMFLLFFFPFIPNLSKLTSFIFCLFHPVVYFHFQLLYFLFVSFSFYFIQFCFRFNYIAFNIVSFIIHLFSVFDIGNNDLFQVVHFLQVRNRCFVILLLIDTFRFYFIFQAYPQNLLKKSKRAFNFNFFFPLLCLLFLLLNFLQQKQGRFTDSRLVILAHIIWLLLMMSNINIFNFRATINSIIENTIYINSSLNIFNLQENMNQNEI